MYFIEKEYLIELCAGMFKYSLNTLKSLSNLIGYIVENNTNLLNYINTNERIYILIFQNLLKYYNYDAVTIKEKVINSIGVSSLNEYQLLELTNTLDKILEGKTSLSLEQINEEFDRILKYIFIKNAESSITKIKSIFEKDKDAALDEYEKYTSELFKKYEKTISYKGSEISLDANIQEFFNKITATEAKLREVSFIQKIKDIKFIQPKRVCTFIAPTGVGKSHTLVACAADYLINAPQEDGLLNLIFFITAENTEEETYARLFANLLEVNSNKLKYISEAEKLVYSDKLSTMIPSHNKLIVAEIEANMHTTMTIKAIIDMYLRKYSNSRVYAVIIDYLDKLKSTHRSKDMREDLGYVTDDLKNLAKDYFCPVITASQTNRLGMEKSKKGKMELLDISESWKKAENSDIIIGLEEVNRITETKYLFRMKVLKHRYYINNIIIPLILDKSMSKFYPTDSDFTNEDDDRTNTFNNTLLSSSSVINIDDKDLSLENDLEFDNEF